MIFFSICFALSLGQGQQRHLPHLHAITRATKTALISEKSPTTLLWIGIIVHLGGITTHVQADDDEIVYMSEFTSTYCGGACLGTCLFDE